MVPGFSMGHRASMSKVSTTSMDRPSTSTGGSGPQSCPFASEPGPRLRILVFMLRKHAVTPHPNPPQSGSGFVNESESQWRSALAQLEAARHALATAPEGIARQAPFDRTLKAGERCTQIVHEWLADSFQLV